MLIDDFQQVAARGKSGVVHAAGQVQIANREIAIFRIGAQRKRSVRRTEIARTGIGGAEIGNANVGGQIFARPEFVRHHAAETRIHQRGAGPVTGEHVLRAALVGRFAVGHRTANRDFVGDLRGLLQQLVEAHAGKLRVDRAHLAAVIDRRVGLGIPRFLMRDAAWQKDVDDAFRSPFFGTAGRVVISGRGLQPKEIAECQAECPNRADLKYRRAARGGNGPGHHATSLRKSTSTYVVPPKIEHTAQAYTARSDHIMQHSHPTNVCEIEAYLAGAALAAVPRRDQKLHMPCPRPNRQSLSAVTSIYR